MTLTAAERQAMTDALVQLEARDGTITPDAVVRAAAEEASPLHRHFEWDDTEAAHAFRLEQARTLIRSVRVLVTTEERTLTTVRYVRDPSVDPDEQGYVSVMVLREDPVRAELLVRQEFDRADACLKRAEEIAEALDVVPVVTRVREQLAKARRTVETATTKRPKGGREARA